MRPEHVALVYPAFERTHRIVLFDHVGAGQSDVARIRSTEVRHARRICNDVLEICEELQLSDVIFVGHSVSAMIGVLAAHSEPDRFKALVLVGPSPRYIDDAGYVGGFSRQDIEGLLELAGQQLPWLVELDGAGDHRQRRPTGAWRGAERTASAAPIRPSPRTSRA